MTFIRNIAICSAALATAAAHAAIIITPGPGNFQGDENVLYNLPGLLDNGPLVQGSTNQSHFIVDLFGAGENLTTPSGGQARVEAVDGGLTDLTLQLHQPGATFGTLIWNLNSSHDGNVTFTIARTGGAPHVQSFAIDKNGQNFFRIEAVGESMISAKLHTDVQLQDVRQIRIGRMNAVPEPASMTALLVGAIGLFARRRRKA